MSKPDCKGHRGQKERETVLRGRRKYLADISKKRNRRVK